LKTEIQFFQNVVQFIYPEISSDELDFLTSGVTIKSYKQKSLFIDIEKTHRTIGFVAKGLIRGYYIDEKGNEVTTRLTKEGGFATHYKAFLLQQPSKYYFQCLEDCEMVCFTYDHIQNAYKKHPGIEHFGRLIAESIVKLLESRVESFQFENAEERYLNFIEQNPNLYNRISLSHLSTYLGIQRPSLSRIRKKIANL